MLQQELDRANARIEVITFGEPAKFDDYGRSLVRLRVNGEDFGARLLRNDLAVESGGRVGWCNGR
jgi:endonuclease YncB( thermonuclease family)